MTMRAARTSILMSVLGATLAVGGCDRSTLDPGPDGGSSGAPGGGDATGGGTGGRAGTTGGSGGGVGAGGGGTGGVGGGPATGAPDGGTCPQAGTQATPATVDGMRAALSRTWILCSPLGLTHQPQDGLVITTGDRYAIMKRDATGALVAQRGVDFEGSITYLALDPAFGGGVQTDFTSDLGGTVISHPVVTQNPTMLIINNEGVYEYRYVAADQP